MLPSVFVSHAAPNFALEDRPVTRFWETLPRHLPVQPRAVLCLSAHWETEDPALAGGVEQPGILYDFHGFAEPLYRLEWPAPGSPELAAEVLECLHGQGIDAQAQPERPLDHGVWVPLRRAWPAPPIPVLQLSLCPGRGFAWHWELGEALAPLRERGVLIVGSGGLVHNLRRLDWRAAGEQAQPWAAEFMDAWEAALQAGDREALCDPRRRLPHGEQAVPTPEHYLPVLAALGAGGAGGTAWHRSWAYGNLACHAYGFGS